MSKRSPTPLQEQATAKRINLENPHTEKYKTANAKINSVVQSLRVFLPLDELLAHALLTIVAYAPPEAGMKAAPTRSESEDLIKENSDLKKALQSAIDQGNYEDIMSLPILQQEVRNTSDPPRHESDAAPSHHPNIHATFKAFGAPYVAGFPEALLRIVDKYYSVVGSNNTVSIVQSSGTGKSRGVEEAARFRFAFLFNLRRGVKHYTYPPPDISVRNYFFKSETSEIIQARYAAFLCALFMCAEKRFSTVDRQGDPVEKWWYNYLNRGATGTEPGPERKRFYEEVVKQAEETHQAYSSAELFRRLKDTCKTFVARLRQEYEPSLAQSKVACILVFDEAQELTRWPDNHDTNQRTYFHHLGSVLEQIRPYATFSVFLSTNSNLWLLAPPLHLHPSLREVPEAPRLYPPITELPFDVFANRLYDKLRSDGNATLSATCAVDVMVCFGRAMWYSLHQQGYTSIIDLAKAKLNPKQRFSDELAQLACLGIRIGLDFDASREVGRIAEFELVESYMRIVFAVPKHREFMRTRTPSEPILAEAAAQLLNENEFSPFDKLAPNVLTYASQRGLLARGERGEMVGRLLWTLAHDAVLGRNKIGRVRFHKPIRVLDFLRSLFHADHWATISTTKPVGDENGLPLSEAFKDAYIHFSHFMDGVNCEVDFKRDYQLLLRGAALSCRRNQRSIDFLTPIFFGSPDSTTINRSNISVLQAQIKNCDAPDDVLVSPTLAASNADLPVLSLVHELGSKKNTVACAPPFLRKETPHAHHYQIVAYGCKSTTYGVIPISMEPNYMMLLATNLLIEDFPRSEMEECASLLRNLEPCSGLVGTGECPWFGAP